MYAARISLCKSFLRIQRFIVTAKVRPRLSGDILEYNTENVRSPPDALVEDLLGQLPCLDSDTSGDITYNGEKIDQLLLDGEDIFGSDPAIVTRNFDAGKIARVQNLE